MQRELIRTELHLGELSERRLQCVNELRLELAVNFLSREFLLNIAADTRIEGNRVGDPIGIDAAASHLHGSSHADLFVDHGEQERIGCAELVVHDLLGVEIIHALILARVSAMDKPSSHGSEGFLHALSEISRKNTRLCGRIIGILARFGADLHDPSLFHNNHALSVGYRDPGAVGNDVVVSLGV